MGGLLTDAASGKGPWGTRSGAEPLVRPWRVWLALGRVSNAPTVWSNCLAGWWLGGAGSWAELARLCVGATLLYVGGMFLNDAFDVDFDRQHRLERPIPQGLISARAVWLLGGLWLALGALVLASLGVRAFIWAIVLIGTILIYDSVHKIVTFSPVLMAACRFELYLLAAAGARGAWHGLAVWSAMALAAYIVGLSSIARKESARGPLAFWPALFLGAPVALALVVDNGAFRARGLALSATLVAWIYYSLRATFWTSAPRVGKTVSGLLAGICWVDCLAAADMSFSISWIFGLFFALALLFQRFIPAT